MAEGTYRDPRNNRAQARESGPSRQLSSAPLPPLLQLQRLAGNQAVCRLLASEGSSPHFAQRQVTYGTDPKGLIKPADNDLLYGLNVPRALTKQRLDANQTQEIRTIDEYNRAVGINDLIKGNDSAIGLYDVRAELASNAAWALGGVALNAHPNLGALSAWIAFLRGHRASIGLEDLGARAGPFLKDKIKRKDRFKKNRAKSQASSPKSDRLTANDVRDFLAPGNTRTTAQQALNAMSQAKQQALHAWIYRAFFRRTSKLGQDFTVSLGGKVHFNTVADPNFDPMSGLLNLTDNGLVTMSKSGNNDKNRAITVSELRHMKKLAKQHPQSFNVYGER